MVQGLLKHVLDHNKHVQEAACSALATLVEQSIPEQLVPRLKVTRCMPLHLCWHCSFGLSLTVNFDIARPCLVSASTWDLVTAHGCVTHASPVLSRLPRSPCLRLSSMGKGHKAQHSSSLLCGHHHLWSN